MKIIKFLLILFSGNLCAQGSVGLIRYDQMCRNEDSSAPAAIVSHEVFQLSNAAINRKPELPQNTSIYSPKLSLSASIPFEALNSLHTLGYEVKLTLKIRSWNIGQSKWNPIQTKTLSINYNNEKGKSYKEKDWIILNDISYCEVFLDKLEATYGEKEENTWEQIWKNDDDDVFRANSGIDFCAEPNILDRIPFEIRAEIISDNKSAYANDIQPHIANEGCAGLVAAYIESTNDVKVTWCNTSWADEYELQWTYVDNYSDNPSRLREPVSYSFRQNYGNARFQNALGNTDIPHTYEMPLVYESGYLIFRIRGIKYMSADFSNPIYGPWSIPEEGRPVTGSGHVIYINNERAHEQGWLNWQRVSYFAENGKRKDVLAYYDATLRQRQTVTRKNDDKSIVVAETIYDRQGRATVQVLPAGLACETNQTTRNGSGSNQSTNIKGKDQVDNSFNSFNSFNFYEQNLNLQDVLFNTGEIAIVGGRVLTVPSRRINTVQPDFTTTNPDGNESLCEKSKRIKYFPDFNLSDASPDAYSYKDFDNNSVPVSGMSTANGAARFYSSENEDKNFAENKFIPDADKYPFAFTEYENNPTQRVKKTYAPGAEFRPGSGKETSYIYTRPVQEELDRIFGTDVGIASHYAKNITIDANGQQAIQYLDAGGKVIATALAGEVPPHLMDAGMQTFSLKTNLLDGDQAFTTNSIPYREASFPLEIESDNQTVNFDYLLDFNTYEVGCGDFCLDCVYDLSLRIQALNVTVGAYDTLIEKRKVTGQALLDLSCNASGSLPVKFSTTLNRGSYLITRRLSVNQDAVNSYLDSIQRKVLSTARTCLSPIEPPTNVPECEIDCRECTGNALNKPAWCEEFCSDDPCRSYMKLMLADVSPGGQYGATSATNPNIEAYNRSVFSPNGRPDYVSPLNACDDNELRIVSQYNWRKPQASPYNLGNRYNNPDLTESVIVENYSALTEYDKSALREAGGGNSNIIVWDDVTQSVTIKNPELAPLNIFLRHWKDSWASALLPYHPEYCQLLYCRFFEKDHNASITAFRKETNVNKLKDWMNNPSLLIAQDKLFQGADRERWREKMTGRINGRNLDGTVLERPYNFSFRHRILAPMYCQNPNFTPEQITSCVADRRFGDDPERLIREWNVFIEMYAQARREIEEEFKQTIIGDQIETTPLTTPPSVSSVSSAVPLCFPGSFIGNREIENNLYADAVRRFPQPFTSSTAVASALGCRDLRCENKQDDQAPGNCNTCRETQHLNVLLASLAFDGRLATPINSQLADHYTMTRNLLDALPNPGELEYTWLPSVSPDGKELTAKIMAGDRLQGSLRMRFEKPGVVWANVRAIMCLEDIAEPFFYRYLTGGKHFTAKAYFNNGTESLIEGHFSINNTALSCGNTCRLSSEGKAVYGIIRHLLDNDLLGSENYLLHTNGDRLPEYISPQIIPSGLAYRSLNWQFDRSTNKGKLVFLVNDPKIKTGTIGCAYEFTFPGVFDVRDQYRVNHVSVNPAPPADGSCNKSSFTIWVRINGSLATSSIPISQIGNCYKLVDCCGCENLITNGNFNEPVSGVRGITGTVGTGSYNELGEVFDQTPDGRAETQSRSLGSLSYDFKNGCYLVNSSISRAAAAGPASVQLWNYALPSSARPYNNYSFGFIVKELRNNVDLRRLQIILETVDGGTTLQSYVQLGFAGFTQVKTHFTVPRGANPTLRIYYTLPGYGDVSVAETNLFAFDNFSLTQEGCNSTCCPPEKPPVQQVPSCEETRTEFIAQQQGEKDAAETERLLYRIRFEYMQKCIRSIERFTAEKEFKIYHYTLYYYDRAGNLIKTIPPEGVFPIESSNLEAVKTKRAAQTFENAAENRNTPQHNLASTYVFNTYNQAISQSTPDAGTSIFMYDELGRAHLSRDARMMADNERKTAYVLYDELGRVFESGVIAENQLGSLPNRRNHKQLKERILQKKREEVSRFYYDKALAGLPAELAGKQENLRNRIALIAYHAECTSTLTENKYDHASLFSYDIHGNSKDIWQHARYSEIPAAHQLKHIHYAYNLASGLVNEITYQPEKTDQFIHRYAYDAENRLMSVLSGTHANNLSRDLKQHYYKHGPLARKELGSEGMLVQGLDYAYTLNGFLKVLNSTSLRPTADMGADSLSEARAAIPADVYGYSLYYYENDYKPIGTLSSEQMPVAPLAGSVLEHFPKYQEKRGLYNGNIMATAASYKADALVPEFNANAFVQAYRYDQLGRLRSAQAFTSAGMSTTNSWNSATATEAFKSTYTYDRNGNLLSLSRQDASGNAYDNLVYHYDLNRDGRLQHNRLQYISDSRGYNAAIGDLPDQSEQNYRYDEAGNLQRDEKENSSYEWTYKSRIKKVRDGSGNSSSYAYDAHARRVLKSTPDGKVQYYVSDASGNALAVYEITGEDVRWKYSPIYAGSRIGTYQADSLLAGNPVANAGSFERGKKRYELGNHLGDVAVVISDRKNLSVVTAEAATFGFRYAADVLHRADYYPFGMEMPGRATSGENYAFAYNGMERDKKAGADGYTTEFRQYDPRVGRWMSVDPKTSKYPSQSPFKFGNNNPLVFNDLKGGEESIACGIVNIGVDASLFFGVAGTEWSAGLLLVSCDNGVSNASVYAGSENESGNGISLGAGVHVGIAGGTGTSSSDITRDWASGTSSDNVETRYIGGADASYVHSDQGTRSTIRGLQVSIGPGFGERVSHSTGDLTLVASSDDNLHTSTERTSKKEKSGHRERPTMTRRVARVPPPRGQTSQDRQQQPTEDMVFMENGAVAVRQADGSYRLHGDERTRSSGTTSSRPPSSFSSWDSYHSYRRNNPDVRLNRVTIEGVGTFNIDSPSRNRQNERRQERRQEGSGSSSGNSQQRR